MRRYKLKPMKIDTSWGKVDLLIERDAGNPIMILMGRDDYAIRNWKKLQRLCSKAIKILKERGME